MNNYPPFIKKRECWSIDICLGGKTGLWCGNCGLPIVNYQHATQEQYQELQQQEKQS